MADEMQEVIAQLKAIADGLQNTSQYGADIGKAMSNLVPIFDKLDNYSEKLAKAMGDIEKSVSATADTYKNSGIAEAIEREALALAEAKTQTEQMRTLEAERALQNKELYQQKLQMDIATRAAWAEASREGERQNKIREAELTYVEKTKKSLDELQSKIAASGYEINPETGHTEEVPGMKGKVSRAAASTMSTGTQAVTGVSKLSEAFGKITGALSGLIGQAGPLGGLIGLMVAGKSKQAEFEAVGQQAGQVFDQMGGRIHGFSSQLGSAARELSVHGMAAKGDLQAVAAAFAESGVTAEEAGKKVDGFSSIVGNKLVYATLAADKALELSAGTMAKLSSTLSRDFNISAEKAFSNLMNMGMAAKEAGGNAATFINQVNEAASALRTLGANGEHAFAQIGGLQAGVMGAFTGAGLSARTAQQRAAAGVSNVAQTLGGMNMGMMGLMGEELGMGSGLDAWYAMASPLGRKGKELPFQQSVQWMANQAKQAGDTEGEQVAFLKLAMGTSTEGAEAILKANKEIDTTGKMSHETLKELNSGFKDESKKTSDIDRNIAMIKDGILKVGLGLLEMIVTGLKMLYSGFMWGIHSLKDILTVGGDKDEAELARLYSMQMEAYQPGADRATKYIVAGAKEIGSAAAGLFDTMSESAVNKNFLKEINTKIDAQQAKIANKDRYHTDTSNLADTGFAEDKPVIYKKERIIRDQSSNIKVTQTAVVSHGTSPTAKHQVHTRGKGK